MSIFLPIAEMPVNWLIILALSGFVGIVSGMTGVGGGFILTPFLIFLGVPAPVAVATQASQITATSASGLWAHARRNSVDWRMGALLTAGGVAGAAIGITVFQQTLQAGHIDILISLFYVVFLGVIGALMLYEATRALRGEAAGARPMPFNRPARTIAHRLPLQMRFPRSGLYISVLPPLAIGVGIGALAAIMGVGGAFVLIPAMIYLLRMPTNVVVGTSTFQILCVMTTVTLMQATLNRSVDLVLAAILILGGVIGAQVGARWGARLPAERIRAALALLMLGSGLKLFWDLVRTPQEMYVLGGQ
jgi:hypothetical protein